MNWRLWVSDSMLTALSANTLYVIGRYNVDSIRAQAIAWDAMKIGYRLFENPLASNFKMLRYVIDKLMETTK